MSSYSVADAKNSFSSLIDSAIAGDEVIITRHGKPVVELRPVPTEAERRSSLEVIRAFRDAGPRMHITTVELLRQMYEDDQV